MERVTVVEFTFRFEGRIHGMADGVEVTCETKREVKANDKIFFWPEQFINTVIR